jgi:hypothetical protein
LWWLQITFFTSGNKALKKRLEKDGSFVLCILTILQETTLGLSCQTKGKVLYLSEIVDSFSGLNCPQLVGKPKLFFFLDQNSAGIDAQVKIDGGYRNQVYFIISNL